MINNSIYKTSIRKYLKVYLKYRVERAKCIKCDEKSDKFYKMHTSNQQKHRNVPFNMLLLKSCKKQS